MKKTNKLIIEYDFDIDLLGMISPAKEYKLVWAINRLLGVRLVKNSDLHLDYMHSEPLVISNFIFETENSVLRVLKNKSLEGEDMKKPFLLPELKNFDYFLMLQGSGDTFSVEDLRNDLKGLNLIQYLTIIEVSKLKSKENLVF